MAVTFKQEGWTLALDFGVKKALVEEAQKLGVTCEKAVGGLAFGLPEPHAHTPWVAPIKAVAITLLKNNSIGAASKEVIASSIEMTLTKVVSEAKELIPGAKYGEEYTKYPEAIGAGKAETLTMALGPTGILQGTATVQNSSPMVASTITRVTPPNAASLLSAPIQLLNGDSELYGMVAGTSSTAQPYVVLIKAHQLAVAARLSKTHLSIRVGGSALGSYLPALELMGFKQKSGYASVHYVVPANVKKPEAFASRTMGAVALSLGLFNIQSIGDAGILGVMV